MSIKVLRVLTVFVLAAFCLGLLVPVQGEMDLYDKIIRLHVIANSDGVFDQNLKLKVRDAILNEYGESFSNCSDINKAEEFINSELSEMKALAQSVIDENTNEKNRLTVSCTLTNEHYPTREYEGLRLPAGTYRSLQIKIGNAEGKNWWCVLFPALCVNSAKAKNKLVEAGLSDEQIRILTDNESPKYVFKFRIIEIIKEIRESLKI